MNRIIALAAAIGLLLGSSAAFADAEKQVNIRPDVASVVVETADGPVTTARGPDGPGGILSFTTEATPDAVVDFYRQRAEAAGLASVMA
ncbi:MAG: hypothetical protein Q8O63_09530, partial [Hoeflea sp.]|nr:hypothetical protein [Hoeflea sp.]